MSENRINGLVLFVLLVLGLPACGVVLPRSAPSMLELAYENGSEADLVAALTLEAALQTRQHFESGFPPEFTRRSETDPSILGVGDQIQILVWESAQGGLFGTESGHTDMGVTEIDEAGRIYAPYVGSLVVAGHNLASVRKRILWALEKKTLAPQVVVRRVADFSRRATVQGVVNHPGIYPIQTGTTRLSQMLAAAGGVSLSPEIVRVFVQRGAQSGSAILKDVYENPEQNIALMPGDMVILSDIAGEFSVFGATRLQGQVKFPKRDLSLLEALALSQGLEDNQANPSGIFLFRHEDAAVVAHLLGPAAADSPEEDTRPIIYRLDLTKPEGIFIARSFQMRNGDAIVLTNAPYTSWRKALSIFSPIRSAVR